MNFAITKYAFSLLSPLVFNAARFTLSVVLLGLLWSREPAPDRRAAAKSVGLATILRLGLFGHVLYQTCFVLGLDRTTSGNAALLIASAPLWTAVVGKAMGIERLGRGAWLGLVLAFAGAVALVLVRGGVGVEGARLDGNVITFFAAAAWGVYTAWSRPALTDISSTGLAFLSMAVALPFLWVVALPELLALDLVALAEDPRLGELIGALLFSGVFSTGLAYVLWNAGVRHVGASHTAVFANLVPIVALGTGAAFLGEGVSELQLLGGGLVLAGVWLVRRRPASA